MATEQKRQRAELLARLSRSPNFQRVLLARIFPFLGDAMLKRGARGSLRIVGVWVAGCGFRLNGKKKRKRKKRKEKKTKNSWRREHLGPSAMWTFADKNANVSFLCGDPHPHNEVRKGRRQTMTKLSSAHFSPASRSPHTSLAER